MEIAANKLLEKYLDKDQIFRENDTLIEGSSYIKEAIIHRALGYTENIKYYIVDTDETSSSYGKVVAEESNIILNEEGKAQTNENQQSSLPFESIYDVIKYYNYKENELTCGAIDGRKANELENKAFLKSKHGYNISKILDKGLIVNNPKYAGFPHFIKKDLFNGDFFDLLI